jgi:DNA-directed RNA polymerase subunit beta'
MRTFHIGGAVSKVSEENRIFLKFPVYIKDVVGIHVDLPDGHWLFSRKGQMIVNKVMSGFKIERSNTILVENGQRIYRGAPIIRRGNEEILSPENAYALRIEDDLYLIGQDQKIEIRNGSEVLVKKGDVIAADKTIAQFDPFSDPIIAEVSGVVQYEDIISGTTLKEEVDEESGNSEKRISEFQLESKQPRLVIIDNDGTELATYFLPGGAYIQVDDGEQVTAGRTIAKTLKESAKADDITSGLPRVSELFEARKPKFPSVLAQISGTVSFKGNIKGKRLIVIEDSFGKEYKHLIPMNKRLLVRDSDTVEAGEALCVGASNPHEVLHIMGESFLHRYLMDEIQQVYRLQGVSINDKHIGVIIRQMMRKVEIAAVGDTKFIYGQLVDKYQFHEENNRVIAEGGQPSVARPVFQGITRASLNIDSFLSAASFQETTRVLTNAAIAGSTDALRGLKENIIIGHPIPAGTGMRRYRGVKLFGEENQDLDKEMEGILERRKLEKAPEPAGLGFSFEDDEYDEESDITDDLGDDVDLEDNDEDIDNDDDEE